MTYPLSFGTKRGSSFGFESSLVFRGRFSIGYIYIFLIEGVYIVLRDVVRSICTLLSF